MDECSQYMLVTEAGDFLSYLYNENNIDLSILINRFVDVEISSLHLCLMCEAYIINAIHLSSDCEYPVTCVVDPCEVADCNLSSIIECESNYCGGCYSDFYDLSGNLVDCNNNQLTLPCDDIGGINFGMCDMYLGVAIVDGNCQYVSGCGWTVNGIDYSDAFFASYAECENTCLNEPYLCEDIEYEYDQLHSGSYIECVEDNDCISIWGDCNVGLGGCHYSVNASLYNENSANQLVDQWVDNDCMEWACDCVDLPSSICSDGICMLSYCEEENPSGCFLEGCDDGYACIDYEETGDCVPSSCYCDEFFGNWFCTEDCNGGTCYELGDVNYDSNINIVDVVTIVNIILGITPYSMLSDVNNDQLTNIIDVVLIIEFILD